MKFNVNRKEKSDIFLKQNRKKDIKRRLINVIRTTKRRIWTKTTIKENQKIESRILTMKKNSGKSIEK